MSFNLNLDPDFNRQRTPVERNIYLRSGRATAQIVTDKPKTAFAQSILIWMIFSFTFGFSFVALYDHALTRAHNSNPFAQE